MKDNNTINDLITTLDQSRALLSCIYASIGPLILNRINSGGKIFTAGNGGSHATAMHLSEELLGKYEKIRRPIGAFCLSADSGPITCISNDFSYDIIFSRQIEALVSEKDVLVLFTTSGNSKNILAAVKAAINKKCLIVIFSGKGGGECGKIKNYFLYQLTVPSDNSARIQEVHEVLMHSLVEYLDDKV